jgi:hypothetical protein
MTETQMPDILMPKYPEVSSEDWIMFEHILPHGYRHVASVERPDADGNVCGKGEVWDLGQNPEGHFRLFRRGTGELENSHVGYGEPVSDADLVGFGLTREQCPLLPGDVGYEGEYSSLCRSNLIPH